MPGRDGEFPVYYQLDVSTVACVAVKGAQQTTAVAIPAERFNQGQKDYVSVSYLLSQVCRQVCLGMLGASALSKRRRPREQPTTKRCLPLTSPWPTERLLAPGTTAAPPQHSRWIPTSSCRSAQSSSPRRLWPRTALRGSGPLRSNKSRWDRRGALHRPSQQSSFPKTRALLWWTTCKRSSSTLKRAPGLLL